MTSLEKTIGTVLNRGFAEKDEFQILDDNIGVTRFWTEELDESFWGIRLTEDRFILANQPIAFWNAPSMIRLVGVYEEINSQDVMQYKPSVELFMKTNRHIEEVE